ncbi:MAG: tetratricopeptide repeat protein [Smithellaceae bacterium]|nr:tetratricopeptide repeat protein [Smithellaceae bacterium]
MRYPARVFLFALILALGVTGCAGNKRKDAVSTDKGFKVFQSDDYKAALREITPLADQGEPESLFRLGSLYHEGNGAPQNHAEAVRLFKEAAGRGHLFSQLNLGIIYAEGRPGVANDPVQSWMWFAFAAAQGYPEAREFRDDLALKMTNAQLVEAQRLVREFKPETTLSAAFRELLGLAERGNPDAQLKTGVAYYYGRGVARDHAAALKWFKAAALQGNQYAQANVGYMYQMGQGSSQDYPEAAKWFEQAARQGNSFAQYNLGLLYEKGQGVLQDEVQALKWFNLASSRGDEQARSARNRLTMWMQPERVAEAHRQAREFTPQAK